MKRQHVTTHTNTHALKYLISISLIYFCTALLVHGQTISAANQEALSSAREKVKRLIAEEGIVGLAISVSLEDSLIWSEGFGSSDLSNQTPISPSQTYFRIASLSKPITATLLGRMHEDGLINWDSSLYHYVPDFPVKKYDFTLRHLAMHRSGIRHYRMWEGDKNEYLSLKEGLKVFSKSRLRFEPGEAYLYSSYGYNLLGVAIQNAGKKPFEELLSTYVTQPLGMNQTIPDRGEYEGMLVSGFFESNGKGKVKEAPPVNMYFKLPSGGMLSTSEDLAVFGNAYAFGRLLQPDTQEEMLTRMKLPAGNTPSYATGWGVSEDAEGRRYLSHTGGNTGAVCRIIVYPEEKLSVAVVSNTHGIDWLKFIRVVNSIPDDFLIK